MKRDAAEKAVEAAADSNDPQAMAAALADYANWREGGDARAALQAGGGALVGGLGGGAFGAIGGAAGAALSSKLADQTRAAADAVTDATGSSLIGNISGNILSGLAGALVGGGAGAAAASNVNLYNEGKDPEAAAKDARVKGIVERALGNAPDFNPVSLGTLIDQFIGQVKSGAQAKMSESPSALAAQGVANGINAGIGMGGGKPPAQSPGAVLVDGTGQALSGGAGSAAYQPDNATLAIDPTSRPSGFRKQTVTDAWDNAADAWDNAADGSTKGTKACPTCGKDVTVAPGQGARDWDVDHQPPWSQRDLTGMTRQEVINEYNSGTRLECPSCNRSRGATPAGQ